MPASVESAVGATRVEVQPGLWLDSRLDDLQRGNSASHRARGNLLPAWDDDEFQHRLRGLVSDYAPDEMLWLGDIVHAAEGTSAVEAYLRNPPARTTVLAENHDRHWRGAVRRSAHDRVSSAA